MADTEEGWRRSRRSRKRGGSDDDHPQEGGGGWSPPPASGGPAPARRPSAATDGPEVAAVVKRFDAERGFGFVALDGGAGDAFLHVSVLQRAGADAVAPGTRLRVRVGRGQKGPQVTEVLEVGEADGAPPPRADRMSGRAPPSGAGEEVRGTVRWYSAEKGFGFVAPDGGGPDVFVHATALGRSGTRPLSEGQAVVLRVVRGRKGPEAETVAEG
jgi:CspA family cold shock protein